MIGQALRGEVESRRALLTNQELSLRERETALVGREAEAAEEAQRRRLLPLLPADDANKKLTLPERVEEKEEEAGEGGGEGLTGRPLTDKYWPMESDWDGEESMGEGGEGRQAGAGEGGGERGGEGEGREGSPGQLSQPLHSFRFECAACLLVVW